MSVKREPVVSLEQWLTIKERLKPHFISDYVLTEVTRVTNVDCPI